MLEIENLIKYVEHGTLTLGKEADLVRERLEPHGYGDFTEKFVELYKGLPEPEMENEVEFMDYLYGGTSIITNLFVREYPQFYVNSDENSYTLKVYTVDTSNPFDKNSTYTEIVNSWSWHSQERATLLAFLHIIKNRGK